MLKKSALTTLAVAAGLVAGAPLASAVPEVPEVPEFPGTESGAPIVGEGNDGQFNENNVTGEHVGQGNTFNGEPIDFL